MPVRVKADLESVDQEALASVMKAANQTAPMVQRLALHRDRFDLAIKELESERFEILSRRDNLRRQLEAVESGFAMHLEDINATLKLYESGMHLVEPARTVEAPSLLEEAKRALLTPQSHGASEEHIRAPSTDDLWLDRLTKHDLSSSGT